MNTGAAIDFLQAWDPEGPWQITAITVDGKIKTRAFHKGDVGALREWVESRQGRENLYFTVNPVRNTKNEKPCKADMGGMRAFHVDLDPRVGEDHDQERARILSALQAFRPEPTVIIDSGGGYQAFWMLDKVLPSNGDPDQIADLESYNVQLEVLLGADSCHNIDRIMRLPGTVNVPNARKLKKGRKPAPTRVVYDNWDNIYPPTKFKKAPKITLAQQAPAPVPGERARAPAPAPTSIDLQKDLPPTVTDRVKMMIVNGSDPDDPLRYASRSEALWGVVCEMVRANCSDEQIVGVITDPDYEISGHILSQPKPIEYAHRQVARARMEAVDPRLRDLNAEYAVVEDVGGRCRVISEVVDPATGRIRLSRQTFDDFRNRYSHIPVPVGEDKTMPLGQWWLSNPGRRQYKTITFSPGIETPGVYNLWRGFACVPREGDCSLFLNHVRENTCSGNQSHYEYLMKWMARAVQFPASPGQVAVVLRGRMGTGKGVVANTFGELWGRHYLHISDPKHLVGSFNAHLRDCVFLFGDEAFYAGDKKHESVMKTLVTESMIMTESKGFDAEASPNFVHLMMASNSEWVVPAGVDERRYFVLDVGAAHMQDANYFKAIAQQQRSGGREALLHHLMTMDLTDFDVRAFPRTKALRDQKTFGWDTETSWWADKLNGGEIRGKPWSAHVVVSDLRDDYYAYCDRMRINRRLDARLLGRFVTKVFPGGVGRTKVLVEVDGFEGPRSEYRNAYRLPALDLCRAHFDEVFGGPFEWEDI